MHSPTFLVILSIALRVLPVLSLAHAGPKPTDASSNFANSIGWTPKPTAAPFAESPLELFRRSEAPINTCGWFDGNAAYPFTCGSGYACSANLAASYFDCCETDASGNYLSAACAYIATGVTTCYDYTDASYCTGACYSENRVCDNSYPYCGKATINLVSEILTNWDCYQSVYARALDVETTVLFTSTFESSSIVISIPSSNSITSTNDLFIPTTPSASDTSTPTSASASTTGSSTSSSTSSPSTQTGTPKPSTSHAGAIAGGVVGGLAGLGLIVGGAIFLLHRRKQREMRVTPPEISQTM